MMFKMVLANNINNIFIPESFFFLKLFALFCYLLSLSLYENLFNFRAFWSSITIIHHHTTHKNHIHIHLIHTMCVCVLHTPYTLKPELDYDLIAVN